MTIFQAYGKTCRSLVEVPGIDPRTSRMLSESSAICATPPLTAHRFALLFYTVPWETAGTLGTAGDLIRDCEPVFELLRFLLSLLFKILICED